MTGWARTKDAKKLEGAPMLVQQPITAENIKVNEWATPYSLFQIIYLQMWLNRPEKIISM